MKPKKPNLCKFCGKSYSKYLSTQKYCSPRCMTKAEEEKVKAKKKTEREKKKVSISALTKKADIVMSRYIRLRDALKTTGNPEYLLCYTCDKPTAFKEAQNMHFYSRGKKATRFTEMNCRGGCVGCNVMLHGNYIEYFKRMENEIGRDTLDKMGELANMEHKLTREELEHIIRNYEDKFNDLKLEQLTKVCYV